MRRYWQVLAVLCLCFSFTNFDAFAITDEEIFRNFQFSFVNPGARSGAMGGAFVGLADDATAAEANPAGLTILTKPEVSLEYRNSQFDEARLNSFQVLTPPGLNVFIETSNVIEEQNRPSFLSVVFPSESWTFGFSRQEVLNQDARIVEDILFPQPDLGIVRVIADGNNNLEIVNWNFAVAAKMGESFSLGATVRYSQLDWQSNVRNTFDFQGISILGTETTIDDDDSGWGFNAGFLWKMGERASVGAVYKYNPKFEVEEVQASEFLPSANVTFTNTLNVPDSFGAGLSVRPNDNMTLAADVIYIKYEDLVDNFQAGHNIFTLGYTNEDIIYNVENEIEFHTGAEFIVFVGSVPVALRAGYYFRPSSSLIVESTPGALPADQVLLPLLFAEREDEHHFTIGNGFVFGPHFQIDWAVDLANLQDDFVLSGVVRF